MVADQEKGHETGSDLFVDPLGDLATDPAADSAADPEATPSVNIEPNFNFDEGGSQDNGEIRDALGGVEVPENLGLEPSQIVEPPLSEGLISLPFAQSSEDSSAALAAELGIPMEGASSAESTMNLDLKSTRDPEAESLEVGNMLEAALPELWSEPAAEAPSLTSDEEETRAFDITIRGTADPRVQEAVLGILKSFPLRAADPDLEQKLRELGTYRATRLSEYHAYALAVHLHRAGIDFQLAAPRLGTEVEEPGLASDVTPVVGVESLGAVAVSVPTKPGEILLSTVSEVPGYAAKMSKGIVTAHGGVARAFFREEEKSERLVNKIQSLQTSGVKRNLLPRAEIDKVFQNLLEKLQREAFRRGANGVLGIQISGFSESSSFNPDADQIRLIASGTAVLLEPTDSGG